MLRKPPRLSNAEREAMGAEIEMPSPASHRAQDEPRSKTGVRRRTLVAIIIVLLILLLLLLAQLLWNAAPQRQGDTGSYIIPQGEMSSDEAQALIDDQAEKSRITISLAPTMKLKEDGSLRVNFIVEEPNNGFSERLEVEQDGQIVYASGAVAPGYAIEWCQSSGAHAGPATATVFALDENGNDRGNPASVEVEIVE